MRPKCRRPITTVSLLSKRTLRPKRLRRGSAPSLRRDFSPLQEVHRSDYNLLAAKTISMEKIALLALELAVVFVLIPLLLYYRLIPNAPIPFLIVLALAAWFILRRDPAFDRSHLTNATALSRYLGPLLLRSAALCAVLGLAVWRFAPHLLFTFVKRAPAFWALVMVLYPVLSVYPQE